MPFKLSAEMNERFRNDLSLGGHVPAPIAAPIILQAPRPPLPFNQPR